MLVSGWKILYAAQNISRVLNFMLHNVAFLSLKFIESQIWKKRFKITNFVYMEAKLEPRLNVRSLMQKLKMDIGNEIMQRVVL